jgi:hypothetical protein
LVVNQHIFPRKSIARFTNEDGMVEVFHKGRQKKLILQPSNNLFCAKWSWDQRSEIGYMKRIEDDFQSLVSKILENGNLTLCEEDNRVALSFLALWELRYSAVYPALAFAASDDLKLHLTNIVPKHVSQIFIKEYNEIASRFANSLNQYSRQQRLGIRAVTTSEELTLPASIPGKRTRELFNRYLALHPRSYHRCDIDRLDTFICAAFRYCRSLDVHNLRRYLVEILKWDEKDANWCCDRVETGLDILRINKLFR